jgi:Ca-activated chloride channel family protein
MKQGLVLLVAAMLAAPDILAQSAPPAPAATNDPPKATDGVRKLTRRERKDRVAKLPERFRQFLEDVEPIMHPSELDTFLILETDAQRDVYINDFWKRRDAIAGTTNQAFRFNYYERIEYARENFNQLSSDRSRMHLLHGEPQERLKIDCQKYLQPIEIWKYFYIPGMGHTARFVFYIPRAGRDYKLWQPTMATNQSLAELVSQEASAFTTNDDQAAAVFSQRDSPTDAWTKIETRCTNGDQVMQAIQASMMNRTEVNKVFEPPEVKTEDVGKILRSVVISTPGAKPLTAEMSVRYPAKQGSRTDTEITVIIPRDQLTKKEVGETTIYSIDVTGEVLRDGVLYENYRYRFDFPGTLTDDKVAIVMDRFLRPSEYTARLKVVDAHSGAESIIEKPLTVPEIFDTPEQRAQKESAAAQVAQLKEDLTSGETRLRIVPMGEELLSGLQKIETIAVGDAIKSVAFYLDGKKIAVKRQPPFTLDLDFGSVPQVRRVRAVALDEKGEVLTGDDIVLNTGNDPFRVRIISPRVANNLHGKTRVEVDVKVPEDRKLEHVELYWNESKVATIYEAPFVQSVTIPTSDGGVGYIRAVARLKDDAGAGVEDVVMINTPAFMEELNVHLVELPTTVLRNGKALNDLAETAFKVLDEGQPVKVTKFEYVKNLPLSLGVAIDTSGSMQPRMTEAQKAAATFLQTVLRPGDRAFVVSFDKVPLLVQKWSPRVADMHAGLAKLRAEDYTALYDAVVFSLYNFIGIRGQKALVIVSDGKDTVSKFTFDQTLEYARRSAVPIYAIGIGIRQTEIDARSKLSRLAAETGGNTYFIERADELGRIYKDVENELRSQYVLGFYPPKEAKSGKWREVTVQVSEGKAKTIRGYYP